MLRMLRTKTMTKRNTGKLDAVALGRLRAYYLDTVEHRAVIRPERVARRASMLAYLRGEGGR